MPDLASDSSDDDDASSVNTILSSSSSEGTDSDRGDNDDHANDDLIDEAAEEQLPEQWYFAADVQEPPEGSTEQELAGLLLQRRLCEAARDFALACGKDVQSDGYLHTFRCELGASGSRPIFTKNDQWSAWPAQRQSAATRWSHSLKSLICKLSNFNSF